MLYFTGDLHNDIIGRFSFKRHPFLRALTNQDVMFCLGDCGCPWFNPELHFYDYWTKPGAEKQDHFQLKWLNQKPWTTIFIAGNHDNYDLIEKMPLVHKYGGTIRLMYYQNTLYDNIYYIDKPTILSINNKIIMVIPGAESHDADYLLQPDNIFTKDMIRFWEKEERQTGKITLFRVNHFSWWQQEKINQCEINKFLKTAPKKVDYVLTHDAPAAVLASWKPSGAPARLNPTESEKILENVRTNIDYKYWLHGHLHSWIDLPHIRTLGLYYNIISEKILADEID